MSSLPSTGMHPFPLITGGGLFLLVVGASIMVGAVARRRLWSLFIVGVAVASAVVTATAKRLAAPLGRPTAFQVESLVVAVLIEAIFIVWLSSRLRAADERRRALSILIVVGVHFFIMAPAFGPLMVLLGLLSIASAGAGLRTSTIPWLAFWFMDGVFKAGIGGAMFWYAPRISW